MIIVVFLASVLFSSLPLRHFGTNGEISTPICPETFSCPNLLPFKYPFYNSSDTQCGFLKVNCTYYGANLQFGTQSYNMGYRFDSNSSFIITNKTFENLVQNKSCEALMDNFTSPTPNLFSISVDPFITLFKCKKNHSSSYAQETNSYFDQPNYSSYNICKDDNFFYYKNPINKTAIPSDLPSTCQVIRLPGKSHQWQTASENPDEKDIFSLLPANIFMSFLPSASCEKCQNKGSRCHNNNGHLRCSKLQNAEKTYEGRTLINPEKTSKGHTLILALVVGVVALTGGAATISIVKIVPLIRKFGWRLKAEHNVNAELFLQNHEFLAPKRYSYSQVQKMTSSFKVKLGQGGFGSVYKGALNNQNLVAVKILSESKGNGEDFINEVASVGRTSHVNIVSLVGFCLEGRRRALIYEFMPNGSLEKFIYSHASPTSSQLGWEKLHQITIGIARGLEYLHKGCNTRILHFDIKPHNILLDKKFCPKISDFGLAKLFPENRSMVSLSNMRGTPGYIAPELFCRSFGDVSHRSDVYSYGMMILEMVGGRRNIEVEVNHTSEIYFPHWIYKKVELNEYHLGLHGIMSDEENMIAKKMIIVGLWCIQTNPLNRPTITKALEMLEGDVQLLEIPPKPYLSSPTRCVGSPSTDPLHPYSSSTNTL